MTQDNKQTITLVGFIAAIIFIVALIISAGGKGNEGGAKSDLVGKDISSFQLMDKDLKPYPLSNLKGRYVVLFFNEGLMCYPACWNQVAAFGLDQRFNSDNVVAISVVVDSPQDWMQAQQKMPDLAKATLLFDSNGSVSRQLGLTTLASSMHRGSLPGHTYVILDKEGVIRYVFDDPTMAIGNDKMYREISSLEK